MELFLGLVELHDLLESALGDGLSLRVVCRNSALIELRVQLRHAQKHRFGVDLGLLLLLLLLLQSLFFLPFLLQFLLLLRLQLLLALRDQRLLRLQLPDRPVRRVFQPNPHKRQNIIANLRPSFPVSPLHRRASAERSDRRDSSSLRLILPLHRHLPRGTSTESPRRDSAPPRGPSPPPPRQTRS